MEVDATLTLLGRWALGVQLADVCLLALFFAALARSVRLQEVRVWAMAWASDAVALVFVFLVAMVKAPTALARAGLIVYAAGKTAYCLLLVAGARNHLSPGARIPLEWRRAAVLVAVWSLSLGLFCPSLALIQLGESFMVGALLTWGGLWILRTPRALQSRWLGWGLLAEGLLFLHYVPVLLPSIWLGRPVFGYLNYSSFFDAAAELLVALASLVALQSSTTEHLRHLNDELVVSQERLRQLVDLDPLTNLRNRRGFRQEVERRRGQDTTLIFLDVDDFKEINDRYGHPVGDACLRRVASALTTVFRPDDAHFRWGGDEFLVVCGGMDMAAAHHRVEAFREKMGRPEDGGPACRISVGVAALPPGRDPDSALREADERMYLDKKAPRRPG